MDEKVYLWKRNATPVVNEHLKGNNDGYHGVSGNTAISSFKLNPDGSIPGFASIKE